MLQSTPESLAETINALNATEDMLLIVVRNLVSLPDRVAIRHLLEGSIKVIVLTVAPGDLQQVLGKEGRTARSLRSIVNAIAVKRKQSMELEIRAEDQAHA
jgi:predicted RNA-binding protein YlqC (UPF0109 family)